MMPPPSSRRRYAFDGFTLIELLVVISIIAVLAGLLLPVVSSVMQNANKTSAKSTEQQIVAAVKNYETEYGAYPVEPVTPTAMDATFDNNTNTTPSAPTSPLYGHNLILFNVLRAINGSNNPSPAGDSTYQGLNSRQIVYFEANDVKNPASAASGFIPSSANGNGVTVKGIPKNTKVTPSVGDLVDPWGNLFYVRIDANYSGMVENPYNTGTTDSGNSINYGGDGANDPNPVTNFSNIIRNDVIAWSPGADGYMGTYTNGSDNVVLPPSSDDVVSWQ